jgi:hypothetical protein
MKKKMQLIEEPTTANFPCVCTTKFNIFGPKRATSAQNAMPKARQISIEHVNANFVVHPATKIKANRND